MVDKMMASYLERKADEFREQGGMRERMTASRLARRQGQYEELMALRAENEQLKADITYMRRELKMARHPARFFTHIHSLSTLALAILVCLLTSGCITNEVIRMVKKSCCTAYPVVERYGGLNNSKDSFIISIRARKEYKYMPNCAFSIKIDQPKRTVVFPMMTPTLEAELSQWLIVRDNRSTRFREKIFDEERFYLQTSKENESQKENKSSDMEESHSKMLKIPVIDWLRKEKITQSRKGVNDTLDIGKMNGDKREIIVYKTHIHTDDIHYFTMPFLVKESGSRYKLYIPYRQEGDIVYLYSPKDSEQLFMSVGKEEEYNTATYFWGGVLIPVAVVLDIVFLPVELIIREMLISVWK